MKQEYLDIINEKDEIIGKEKKSIAVGKNLLRRVVHTFIFNKKGQLLVQKRSLQCKIRPGMFTSSSSGHVSSGEDYEAAAHRELKEEIGIDTELEFVAKFRIKDQWSNAYCSFFIGKTEKEKFEVEKSELEYVKFMDLTELNDEIKNNPNIFGNTFKKAFKIYCEKSNGGKSM